LEGFNRIHAVLGTSERCIATNPSDMNVALAALDGVIRVSSLDGERSIPFEEFHLTPGESTERETVLKEGELITAVDLPASPFAANSLYLKVRDRASYEFALTSVALAVAMSDGRIGAARVAFGGVATKPWRARNVEQVLERNEPSEELFERAAKAASEGARPRRDNVRGGNAERTVVKALRMLRQAGKMGYRHEHGHRTADRRVDGRLKITGAAQYAADFPLENMATRWPYKARSPRQGPAHRYCRG
jgi:xanthine dehydrogenase YagS FAD-binding subunit